MKHARLVVTLLAIAVGMIGCGKEEPKPAAKAPEAKKDAAPPPAASIDIKIAHVGPLTGGIAHLGKDNENGARLAVEQANEAKIKIDGKDAKFIFSGDDDQADPKVGTTVAQKLVDAKVAAVIGTTVRALRGASELARMATRVYLVAPDATGMLMIGQYASSLPCSAALRYQLTASAKSWGTPLPSW